MLKYGRFLFAAIPFVHADFYLPVADVFVATVEWLPWVLYKITFAIAHSSQGKYQYIPAHDDTMF
ncbi:MAG: hypothetical protein ABI237_04580, partial [Ginsengibacter sp.]